MKSMEDEQLMRDVRAGEIAKLEMLFDRHSRALLHYYLHLTGNRAVSEDMVQEVFFRILKYRHTYRTESTFRAWMFQIARNVHADHAGKTKAEVAMPDDFSATSDEVSADRQVQKKQETALLHRALAALPQDKREVLIMSRFLELRYDEIATVLKCETGTVKVRVYRALRELGDRFLALRGERAAS